MKILALNPNTEFDYVLESQRDDKKQDQIIWKLKMLSAKEDELLDNAWSLVEGEMKLNLGTQTRLALDIGLVGVENFFYADGTPVTIERSTRKMHGFVRQLTDETLSAIPKEVRGELAKAIMEGSQIGEEDVKN